MSSIVGFLTWLNRVRISGGVLNSRSICIMVRTDAWSGPLVGVRVKREPAEEELWRTPRKGGRSAP